ncbi:MAG: alpha/beta hydrolase [Microthrixaceae bacterium]
MARTRRKNSSVDPAAAAATRPEVHYRFPALVRRSRRSTGLPDRLVQRIAGDPVEIEGRVLSRDLQLLIALAKRTGSNALEGQSAQERRRELKKASKLGMPVATNVHVHERIIEGPASPIRLRVYRPHGVTGTAPAIVYFHGGGWVVGDLDTHDGSCRVLAVSSACVVVSVDYRLAPENPYPAAVDDCIAAYQWVARNGDELAVDGSAVGVMGDSAGGNLAAVVAQAARDIDAPRPVAQGLVYPGTDFAMGTRSVELFAEGFFLTRESMQWFRQQYLPDGADKGDPSVSPLLAQDVSGVAPALVWTAGFDPLRDEGSAYAEKLDKAGVPTTYRCYDDLIHGFFGMGTLPGMIEIIEEISAQMGDLVRSSAEA